jgi:hypothetical protein
MSAKPVTKMSERRKDKWAFAILMLIGVLLILGNMK